MIRLNLIKRCIVVVVVIDYFFVLFDPDTYFSNQIRSLWLRCVVVVVFVVHGYCLVFVVSVVIVIIQNLVKIGPVIAEIYLLLL